MLRAARAGLLETRGRNMGKERPPVKRRAFPAFPIGPRGKAAMAAPGPRNGRLPRPQRQPQDPRPAEMPHVSPTRPGRCCPPCVRASLWARAFHAGPQMDPAGRRFCAQQVICFWGGIRKRNSWKFFVAPPLSLKFPKGFLLRRMHWKRLSDFYANFVCAPMKC